MPQGLGEQSGRVLPSRLLSSSSPDDEPAERRLAEEDARCQTAAGSDWCVLCTRPHARSPSRPRPASFLQACGGDPSCPGRPGRRPGPRGHQRAGRAVVSLASDYISLTAESSLLTVITEERNEAMHVTELNRALQHPGHHGERQARPAGRADAVRVLGRARADQPLRRHGTVVGGTSTGEAGRISPRTTRPGTTSPPTRRASGSRWRRSPPKARSSRRPGCHSASSPVRCCWIWPPRSSSRTAGIWPAPSGATAGLDPNWPPACSAWPGSRHRRLPRAGRRGLVRARARLPPGRRRPTGSPRSSAVGVTDA